MPYFPKHFITTDLQTNGNELQILRTGENYIGLYWKTGNGKFYSGQNPQANPSYELIPIPQTSTDTNTFNPVKVTSILNNDDSSQDLTEYNSPYSTPNTNMVAEYLKTTNKTQSIGVIRVLPVNSPNLPTQDDYEIGEFRRYFLKKTNNIIYTEVDRKGYNQIVNKDPGVVWELYRVFNLPWTITGDKDTVYRVNKNIVDSYTLKYQLPKLGDFLNHDYLKYYK